MEIILVSLASLWVWRTRVFAEWWYSFLRGLPPGLIDAVIAVESSGRADVTRLETNGQTAYGLMQVLGSTADWIDTKTGWSHAPDDLLLPHTNIKYGSWYLEYQMRRYGGDVNSAIAAYNAGSVKLRGDGFFVNQDYVDDVLETWGMKNA